DLTGPDGGVAVDGWAWPGRELPAVKYRSADRCLALQLAARFSRKRHRAVRHVARTPGAGAQSTRALPDQRQSGHQSTDESLVSARSTELHRCRLLSSGPGTPSILRKKGA